MDERRVLGQAGGWLRHAAAAVATDLAVHGLAYFGVLLLFAGLFGFMVFSFDSLDADLRLLAEIDMPLAALLAAWFLRRSGAPFAASALSVLAGVLIPVVAVTAFVDGSDVPPDLTGFALVAVTSAECLAVAAAYLWYCGRKPESPLRYLVGPVLWLAVTMAAHATKADLPRGRELASPGAVQMAVVAAAVVLSVFGLRLWRSARAAVLEGPTLVSSAVGYAVVYVLAVLAASHEDWPPLPLMVTGLAGLVLSERFADRVHRHVAGAGQALLLAAALAPLGPRYGAAVMGAAAAVGYLGLAEWIGRRRPSAVGLATALAGGMSGIVFALGEPWPTVVASLATWVWVVWTRVHPPAWIPAGTPDTVRVRHGVLTAAALVLPAGVAFGLGGALPTDTAVAAFAVGVAAVAVVSRLLAGDDVLWPWWTRGFAAASGAAAWWPDTRPGVGAAALGSVALALAVAPRWPALRPWLAAAPGAAAVHLALEAADVDTGAQAVVLALAAIALVGAAALGRAGPAAGHVGLVGHGLGYAALLPAEAGGWPAVAVTAAFATGWAVSAAGAEIAGRDAVCALLARVGRGLATGGQAHTAATQLMPEGHTSGPERIAYSLPIWMAALSFVVVLRTVLEASEVEAPAQGWAASTYAILGAAYAGLGWLLRRRPRPALALSWSGLVVAFFGTGMAAGEPGAGLTAAAAALGAAVAAYPVLRQPAVAWWGWLDSAIIVVQAGRVLGVGADSVHLSAMVWGAVVLVGVLALDEHWAGRRSAGEWIRDERLRPAAVIGAVAVVGGFLPTFLDGPDSWGPWAFGVAAITFVVTAQLRLPALSGLGWVLTAVGSAGVANAGFGSLTPRNVFDHPWAFVAWAAIPLAFAALTGPKPGAPATAWYQRWDLPAFAAAHAAAIVGLASAPAASSLAVTYVGAGALSLAVAAGWRRWEWLAAGVALVDIGAADAGLGWLSLALLGTAGVATAAARRVAAPFREALDVVAAAALLGSWWSFTEWTGWPSDHAGVAVALAGGVVGLWAGAAARWAGLSKGGALGASFVSISALVYAFGSAFPDPGRVDRDVLVAEAGGLFLLAVGCALAAAPLAEAWLREMAATLVLAAGAVLAYAFEPSAGVIVWSAAGAGLAATVAAAGLWVTTGEPRPRGWSADPWLRPAVGFAVATALTSVVTAATVLPRRDLLVPALLVAAAEAALFGALLEKLGFAVASPLLACAAWMVFASEALTGNPQWFSVPAGLTILVVVALLRQDRRRRDRPVHTHTLAALDDVGMAFVVGSALAQTIVESVAYGLLAAAFGVGFFVWGTLTKVRRRAVGGAGTVTLAVLLIIGVPMADIMRNSEMNTSKPLLWILLSLAGLLAIFAAALLEQGRSRVRQTLGRIGDLTRDWE